MVGFGKVVWKSGFDKSIDLDYLQNYPLCSSKSTFGRRDTTGMGLPGHAFSLYPFLQFSFFMCVFGNK